MIISVSFQNEEPWFLFAQQKEPLQDGFYQCDLRDKFFIVKTIHTKNAGKGYYQKFKTINVTRGTISDGLPAHLESPGNSYVRKITGNIKVEVEIESSIARSNPVCPRSVPVSSNRPVLEIPTHPQTENALQNPTSGN
jgi:hypothetical protein